MQARILAAIAVVAVACAGAMAGLVALKTRNTLENDGTWIPTKMLLQKEVLGARSYWQGRQALAGGMLALGAWHGYHEVLFHRPVEAESISADLVLHRRAWIVALVYDDRREEFAGVRLSLKKGVPSAFVSGSASGGFRTMRPIAGGARAGVQTRIRLQLDGAELEAFLDGRSLGRFSHQLPGPHRVGFRGGFQPAFVDNVRIETSSGGIVKEGFELPRHAAVVATACALISLALVGGLFLLLAKAHRRPPQHFAAWCVMMGISFALSLGILYGFVARRPPDYPRDTPELRRQENQARRHLTKQTRQSLFARYGKDRGTGTFRILVVGASQAWGSGARREADTWAAVLERLVADAASEVTVECINAGIPSATAPQLIRVYENHLMKLAPDLVIIALANNDKDAAAFRQAIERMVIIARDRSSRVALIPEPNSPERQEQGIDLRRQLMTEIAAESGAHLVEMHDHLAARFNDGFLWWDKVHLTSFGNRLFAQRLFEVLTARSLVPGGRQADSEPLAEPS